MCAKRFPDRDIEQHDSVFQVDLKVDEYQSTSGNSASRLSESKAKEQNLEKKLDKVTQEKSQTEYKLKENEVKLQENEDRFKYYSRQKESELASLKVSINSYKEKLAKKERKDKSMKESHAAEIEKLTVELAKMKNIYDNTVLQLTQDKLVLELQLKDKEIEEHSLQRQIEEAKRENAELWCSQLESELKELRRLMSQTSLSSQIENQYYVALLLVMCLYVLCIEFCIPVHFKYYS